jgi:hypothetical protein
VADSGGFEQAGRVGAAASRLRVDAATAEVLQAFDAASIRSVLLKGPALAAWYDDDPTHAYLDCDLWIGPADVTGAGEELTRLGFKPVIGAPGVPTWWLEHATGWWRARDGVLVDLHHRLQGVGVDAPTAWRSLSGATETINVGGYPASVLDVRASALYVTLHACHHGKAVGKALSHLERALRAVEEPDWIEAASLAQRLKATDAFATGLRLLPEGAELAARLSLQESRSVNAVLHAGTPPPTALSFEQLARVASLRERIVIIAGKAFPPPSFIRYWWPAATRNRKMLAIAYLYRPVWLLRHAPRGFQAWRSAKRAVRTSVTSTVADSPESPVRRSSDP